MTDAYQVRIRVERPCRACKGGQMPDPNKTYRKKYGSTVRCIVCKGSGWAASKSLTLSELYDLLNGNLPRSDAGAGR